jgi:hypothetical protein
MSLNCREKAKQPRSEGARARRHLTSLLPNRHRTNMASIVQSDHSLPLLCAQPEILRKVSSFLALKALKDALILRQVHRKVNEGSNDFFQYSFIMNRHVCVDKARV